MKILIYADLQADIGSERLHSDPTKSLRLYCVEKFFDDLKHIYQTYGCSALYDLGDTFDDRNAIEIPTLNAVLHGLRKLPNKGLNVRTVGNHDQYQLDGSIHNGQVLEPFFKTVSTTLVKEMEGFTAFYVAYPHDHTKLTEWLIAETRKVRGKRVLFGHFQVQGAVYKGAKALTGVPVDVLKSFETVLLGHIHLPQTIAGNIHYVGSPFQQDWGEAGQIKRVAIFDTSTLTVQWVPLRGYPQYHTVSFSEFVEKSTTPSEDRFHVKLKTHAETEKFLTHPEFGKATSEYCYDAVETQASTEKDEEDWSFESLCRRYMSTVPPEKVGIDMPLDELLESAHSILET